MPQVIRADEAELDLIDILVHIGRHNPLAVDNFADEVEQKCQLLAQFPGMGAERDDVPEGVRVFAVGSYVLFYRPIDGGIELLRVLFGGRRITPRMFQRP
ncbi:MAG TPA: type II toxin-antitoxin system RelE/ParE family toxin [Gemmataceae bacterium]|nr:type II toxin-antitoxin system RelE/ParE family toxin [Gemmataceae bacterium]